VAELVRLASLTGYLETMARLGADPHRLLKEQGLSAEALATPEQMTSASGAIRLLERSAAVTGCQTLGLRMAEGRSLANLGAVSLLVAHQPTLRAALEAIREYRVRINSTLVLHLEELGEEAILREDFALRSPEPARQSSDLALGVLAKLCAMALGEAWAPLTVCFTHQAPPPDDQQVYYRVFRCRPHFDSAFTGIVLHQADLDRPNARADPQLAGHARYLLESVMHASVSTTAEQAEQLIKLLLPAGRASVQVCAATMGLTVRTLQRALAAEGETFSTLLNRARVQLASQYLANPRMRVTDVADLLGYSAIGAFTRWHRQTFGVPPRARRMKA
jgi:AraC-like DNA-binding protein